MCFPASKRDFCVSIFLAFLTLLTLCGAKKNDLFCLRLKDAKIFKGFQHDVPDRPISGHELKTCDRGPTCCTPEMESRLVYHAKNQLEKTLGGTISQLRHLLGQQGERFDEFFKALLKTSKSDFHTMFLKTYGLVYDRNSYLFQNLFESLEGYYKNGGVNLEDALEEFFDALYKKMFQVLNAQYSFNEHYLQCVSQQFDVMKPFGDVPKKLTVEVKRSFVATRTFVQALIIGRDVLKHFEDYAPTTDCIKSYTKMTTCHYCRGLLETKPCQNYCHTVTNGCLSHLADVQQEWSNYINAMIMLASRLQSSFNIEAVVSPIDIKISDAIMNYQESATIISQQLYKACGQPRLGKRNARHELTYESIKFGHQENSVRPTTAAGTSIDRLVQSITKKIKRTKNFFSHANLSKILCNYPSTTESQAEQKCWNGSDISHNIYEPTFGTTNYTQFLNNSHQEWLINQQILTLQLITTKLTYASNGLDVHWIDTQTDSEWESSGSGSGEKNIGFETEEETTNFGDIYFSVSTPGLPAYVPGYADHPSPSTPSGKTGRQSSEIFSVLVIYVLGWLCRYFVSPIEYG